MAGLSKTMIWVSTAALGLRDCSWKGPRTRALFNASITGAAHVGVHTDSSIHPDSQASKAFTSEGALCVYAPAIHTDSWCLTLVDVDTVASVGSQHKPWLADTFEAAIFIDTHPIEAHIGCGTFIVINAVLAIRGDFKASIADTLKAAISINTASIPAHHSIHDALINIDASLLCRGALEAFMALAVIGARCVHTITVHTGAAGALIHINAFSTHILLVPHVALTAVAGWGGDAASVQAEVSEMLADVNGLI